MLAPTIESQKSDIFLRKPCLLLVGACTAGPPKVRGQISGSAGAANAGRASPALTAKSRNSVYNQTHSLTVHCRGGALLHPRSLAAAQGFGGRAWASPAALYPHERALFSHQLCLSLVGACLAGPPTVRPAFGTPAAHLSGRKHFPIAKKDPQTKPFAGLSSWCTIGGSVQKTVQCTVFSDRSPRGECKPHRGAARARPVGDGAPYANLSAAHNAKKDPQVYRLQVLFPGAPSGTLPRANQHRTVVLVAACGRPPCSRPWCKPKKSPRS